MFRKQYIIDKKFQLRTAFRIIGIIIITFIIIIAAASVILTDNNKKINSTISDLNRSMAKEKKIIESLIESAGRNADSAHYQAVSKLVETHLETMALIHTNIQHLNKALRQNRILVTFLIISGMVLGAFLFFYLIRLTHHISGPLYVMTQHMTDIMNGKKPDIRSLRKNDELKEFYQQFSDFIKKK